MSENVDHSKIRVKWKRGERGKRESKREEKTGRQAKGRMRVRKEDTVGGGERRQSETDQFSGEDVNKADRPKSRAPSLQRPTDRLTD